MFGGGNANPYDDIVAKSTDENMTSENWELILNLCDKVQDEGQEGARDVIAAILKRLAHRNPNVQLYALTLVEALSKNCTVEVHREIASKAFTQGLEKIITDRTTHDKVKKRALGLIATWTADWENDATLGVMEDCYNNLKSKNYKFETPQEAPPPTVDDEIRRKEEEELQRVLEMSMQDKGGRSQWSSTYTYSGASGSGSGGAGGDAGGSSSSIAAPKYQSGYVPARTPSPQPQPQSQPQPQPQPQLQQPHAAAAAPVVAPYQPPQSAPASTTSPATTLSGGIVTRVRALHTFESTEPGELAFEKGDIIKVVDRNYPDWWRGQVRGRTGIFPVNYVEPIPEPTSAELAKEAEQEAAVFAQAVNVEKLLSMLKALDPSKDNLTDNEEIQELYRSSMALRPKIVKLIDKYSQKRADLVSMNETFVKARTIFDRMMEESLARHTGMYDQQQPAYRPGPSGPPYGWSPNQGPAAAYAGAFPTPIPVQGPTYDAAAYAQQQAQVAAAQVRAGQVQSPQPAASMAAVAPGGYGVSQQGYPIQPQLQHQQSHHLQQQPQLQQQQPYGVQGPTPYPPVQNHNQGGVGTQPQPQPQSQPQPQVQQQQQQSQSQQPYTTAQQQPGAHHPSAASPDQLQSHPHAHTHHQAHPSASSFASITSAVPVNTTTITTGSGPSLDHPTPTAAAASGSSSPPQQQTQPHQQKVISGNPPFVYDATATYADPNVQAWAQYYAQGGKEKAGLVYFTSVPGITDAGQGQPQQEQLLGGGQQVQQHGQQHGQQQQHAQPAAGQQQVQALEQHGQHGQQQQQQQQPHYASAVSNASIDNLPGQNQEQPQQKPMNGWNSVDNLPYPGDAAGSGRVAGPGTGTGPVAGGYGVGTQPQQHSPTQSYQAYPGRQSVQAHPEQQGQPDRRSSTSSVELTYTPYFNQGPLTPLFGPGTAATGAAQGKDGTSHLQVQPPATSSANVSSGASVNSTTPAWLLPKKTTPPPRIGGGGAHAHPEAGASYAAVDVNGGLM